MPLDIVRGRISNVMATKELIPIIEKLNLGYPLSANAENTVTVDALFISNKIGIVAFIFTKLENLDEIIEEQGELYFQLTNTLTQYPNLRKGRSLAVDPHVISIVPVQMDGELEDGYILSTFDDVPNAIDKIPTFDTKYYKVLVESLQRIASIKPRKKRENVKNSGSKGDIIKK